MFKLQKPRSDRTGEKADFRFLQFHATRIPPGWDKLIVSVISVDTGKAVARTNKALVRGGSCQWSEAVSESVRFSQDDNSKEVEERLFKFVVSMGSARSNILGEATINLADYLSSNVLIPISLPLKKCSHGTVLHVKIQCLTPRAGSREPGQWRETAMEQDDVYSVSDDADNRSENSDYLIAGSVGSSSGNRLGGGFQQSKDGVASSATSRLSSESIEVLSPGSSAVNGNSKNSSYGDQVSPCGSTNSLPRRQDSTGSGDGITASRAGYGQDPFKSSPTPSFSGKVTGQLKLWQERATQGSHVDTENVNRVARQATLRGSDSSKGFFEAAELTIQELRREAMMWERNARKSGAEIEGLKQQLSEQAKHISELGMEFSAVQSERDSFKLEVEQLKSSLQASKNIESSLDNVRLEKEDAKQTVKELQEEIALQKESNVNLELQLRKTQESNMELVSALQELEETIERQNIELDKFSKERQEVHGLETLGQEFDGSRKWTESGAPLNIAEAERDRLKQEVERLNSALQSSMAKQSIPDASFSQAEDVKCTIEELQAGIKIDKESNYSSNLQLQKTEESNKQLLFIVQSLEEKLKEQDREIERLSRTNKNLEIAVGDGKAKQTIIDVEAEWMQKLFSKEEEIRRLQTQISGFETCNQSTKLADSTGESQEDLHKALEALRREMEELERDCKELTNENMELIYKLKMANKDLESKNAYIAGFEEKLVVQSGFTIHDACLNLKSDTCEDGIKINGMKDQVNQPQLKIPSSENSNSAELTDMEELLNQSKNQVIELQNQNSSLEIQLGAFKDRIRDLESELEMAKNKTVKNEIEFEVLYEQKFKDIEARAAKAEGELADFRKRIESFDSNSAKNEMAGIVSEHDKQFRTGSDHVAGVQYELDYDLKKIVDLEADQEMLKGGLLKQAAERHNAENLISNLHQLNEELDTRIQDMGIKKSLSFSQVSVHAARVSQLQQQLDGCASRGNHLQDMIQQLECANLKLESEIRDMKEERRVNRSCIEELEFQLSVLTEEIQPLTSSRREFEMRASNLQMEKEDLEARLELTQDECKIAKEHLEELSQELEKLTVCMESQMSVKRSLEKKAMELESSKEELEGHLTDLEQENVQLSERISGLEAQLRYLTEERESYRLELENTKSRGLDLQTDVHRLEDELRGENVELQQRLQESEKKLCGALEEAESRNTEHQQLQVKLQNLMREYSSVHDSKVELQEQLLNVHATSANLEEQLKNMTERFSSSLKQVNSLESELATLKKDNSDRERIWAVERQSFVVLKKELEQKLLRAEEALSQLRLEKVSTVEHLQNEVQRLTEQMSSTCDEKERMATEALLEASELRAEKVKLEDSLQQFQGKVRQCEMELVSVRQDNKIKLQEMMLQLDASKEREEDMNVKQGNALRQLEDMKFSEADFKQRVYDLERKIAVIENERQKLKEENNGLNSQVYELVNLRAQIDVLRSTIEDIRVEKNRLESSLHLTDSELGRLRVEKASFMEKLTTMQQAISEGDRVKAALEEKILRLQAELSARDALSAHGAEQKNEFIKLKRLNSQWQRKLHDLEEEKEEFKTKVQSLEKDLQLKASALPKAEQKCFSRSYTKVGYTSPSRDTKEVAELREKLRFVESELDTLTREFVVKERDLCAKIEYLENTNRQLGQAKSDSNTDQLQVELTRLQKQNSLLSQKEHELLSKVGAQEFLERELQSQREVNKQLQTQLLRFRETVKAGNILDRIYDLETELAEALEANTMYKSQLRSILCQEQNVHVAALQNFGSVEQIVNDLTAYKKTTLALQAELKDTRERCSQMSAKLAEVEAQREELTVTVKSLKNGRRWFR